MNPRTRRAALHAIGAIAILASANALAHSYAGLYDWATHHRLSGWQARSWPAEIDVFLAVGELALYVACLDAWPARQRAWPWATALTGLAVSIAGNVGHIQAGPGHPVILADRLTAATSPIAAFAGLSAGLLVLKMTRQQANVPKAETRPAALALAASPVSDGWFPGSAAASRHRDPARPRRLPARLPVPRSCAHCPAPPATSCAEVANHPGQLQLRGWRRVRASGWLLAYLGSSYRGSNAQGLDTQNR